MRLSTERDRDEIGAIAVLHAALDAGVTLLDTAGAYCWDDGERGHNERLIARALSAWHGDRSTIVVATKGGMTRPDGRWVPDGRAKHLAAACEDSCRALGVQRLELYHLHAPDPRVPLATSVRALAALKRAGLISSIGLCNVTVGQIEEARRIAEIDSIQAEVSLWHYPSNGWKGGGMRTAIAAIALLILIGHSAFAQQAPPATDTSRGLLIRFADGRMHTKPLRPKGGIWTANFPKVPGAKPSHEGVPLSVIDIRHVVEGSEVVVTVSLSYGAPNKNQVTVAVVRLTPGAAVEVNELRGYGVEPISLSIVSIPSTPANVPETVSPSTLLDLRAEQSGPNASSYRVVLTNRSDLPLMWVRFQGYRDGKLFTGGQGGPRNTPLVEARSQHGFEIAIGPTGFVSGSESQAWSTIDRIEITCLMWQDGTVEGDRGMALQRARTEEQRSAELRMLVDALAAGRGQPAPDLRSRISSLTIKSPEVLESTKSLTADLDSLLATGRSRDDLPFDPWLTNASKVHQEWLNRIVVPRVDR